MSPEWLSAVYQAAEECSDEMIFQLLAKIPPESNVLRQTLSDLANNFLFDEIMELTKPTEI